MSMIALAAVLLSGQSAAPPARSAEDLTRDLNSAPPSAVAPIAPRPAPATESEAPPAQAAPARPAPSRPSTSPQTAPAPRSQAPSSSAPPARPAPTGSTSSLTRDLNSGPPSASPAPRPSTPAPTPTTPAARPAPTPAPEPSAEPAPAPVQAAPTAPAPAETLAEAAVEALPFRIDLPEGFEVEPSDAGPNAKVYAVRKDGRSFVMIYQGPASQFPIYDGELIDAGGRASVVVDEGGRRRAVEHLFAKDLESRETHVWVSYLEGPDAAQAEQIAQSVEPR